MRMQLRPGLLTLPAILLAGMTAAFGQTFDIIPRERLDMMANPVAAADSPMQFEQTTLDLGTIDEDADPKSVTFFWKNAGDEPVVIAEVRTGCGCAAAAYDRRPVLPDERGAITVTYRPKGHPGSLQRKIVVFTHAGTEPAAVLTLVGSVTPSAVPVHDYPFAIGDLRLKQLQVRMRDTERNYERIEVLNAGEHALTIQADTMLLPDCLTVQGIPAVLEPGAVGDIEIGFNPAKAGSAMLPRQLPVILTGFALPPSRRSIKVYFGEDKD